MTFLTACHLGPYAYREGLRLQEGLVLARAGEETGDWLLFPDHAPVLTMGRGGSPASLRVDAARLERLGIELFEVARGGDITWHGPGQLVGYLICDLASRGRDTHRFLRSIEQGLIETLGRFGIAAGTAPGRTGVWVSDEKIASIGVAVRRWVSYHGFALNVAPDLGYFDLIHPCGLEGVRMTSMARLLGAQAPPIERVRDVAAREMAAALGYRSLTWVPRELAERFLPGEEARSSDAETTAAAARRQEPTPSGRAIEPGAAAVREGATAPRHEGEAA